MKFELLNNATSRMMISDDKCKNMNDAIEILKKFQKCFHETKETKVLFIKISNKIDTKILSKIHLIDFDKECSLIISVSSVAENKCFIYWKNKNQESLRSLQCIEDASAANNDFRISKFIVQELLLTSIENGRSGRLYFFC
jgi:hypothetical protein